MDSLDRAGRIAFWGMVGVPGALMIWALNILMGVLCPPRWPGVVIGALAGALGVLPLMILNAAGMWLSGLDLPERGLAGLLPYVAPTVIGISVLVWLLLPADRGAITGPAPAPSTGLLARLPPEPGKDIIAVQAQDHYVKVSTTRGSHMILMRMSDAGAGLSSPRACRSTAHGGSI